MFSGIITDQGRIKDIIQEADGGWFYWIHSNYNSDEIKLGDSIACNGACLTVFEKKENMLSFGVSEETLEKTNLKFLKIGDALNLEKAMALGASLDGHIVTGHVDGLCELTKVTREGTSYRHVFYIPKPFHRFVASKGSICLNGVSLTVNEVFEKEGRDFFGVNIIDYTWSHTNFSDYKIGDQINFEIDILARYMQRYMETS